MKKFYENYPDAQWERQHKGQWSVPKAEERRREQRVYKGNNSWEFPESEEIGYTSHEPKEYLIISMQRPSLRHYNKTVKVNDEE